MEMLVSNSEREDKQKRQAMKDINRENGMKWIGLLLICAVFISSTMLTGCGDNSNGGARVNDGRRGGRTASNGGGTGDQGYFDLLTTGINQSADGFGGSYELAVELFTPNGEQAGPSYYGPVRAYGYLDYAGPEFLECGFRDDLYDLETVNPNGVFGSDQVTLVNWSGTVLEAYGRNTGDVAIIVIGNPYSISGVQTGLEFEEAQPRQGVDGFTYHNSFWGEVIIDSVDGFPCGVGVPRTIFFNTGI